MRLALISCRVSALFRNGLALATERSGKVLELGQAVAHREQSLSVVYVHSGREFECRQCRGVDVDEAKIKIWMVGHKVAAALVAILSLAFRGLGKGGDVLSPGGNLHHFRLPERE